MNKAVAALLMVLGTALAFPAQASERGRCGSVPNEKWLTQDAAKSRLAELGYDVRSIKVQHGCYEAKVVDKNGVRLKLYVNPETGAPITRTEGRGDKS